MRAPRKIQLSTIDNSPFTRWNALKCSSMLVGQPMRTYCCTFDIVESRRVWLAISLAVIGIDSTAFNNCITSPGIGISRSRGGGSHGNRLKASAFWCLSPALRCSVVRNASTAGSTENKNLLSARAAHYVQTLRALLSAMEPLPQAPWPGKAARFMANSGTPHLWAHVRQFFLKSLMFYIFFGWCRCDGAMSSHKTLVKTFAFSPKHCMMTGGNQPTMAWTVTSTGRITELLCYTIPYYCPWIAWFFRQRLKLVFLLLLLLLLPLVYPKTTKVKPRGGKNR